MENIKESISSMLEIIKEEKPLVHCITNYVTINDCANILLSIGAKPIMADAIDEVGEVECQSSALVINIGMITYEKMQTIIEAGKIANKVGVPVILDPVGINISSFRKNFIFKIMKKVNVNIIRGNVSEILCLCDKSSLSRGVDSLEQLSEDEAKNIVINASRKYKCIVAMTGISDYISNGERIVRSANGNKMLAYVSGTGCMTTSLIGAFAGVSSDYFNDAVAGVMIMGILGEIAFENLKDSEGSGSYKVRLLDAAFNLKFNDILKRGHIYEY